MKYPSQSDIWRLEQATSHGNGQSRGSRVLARFHQRFPLTVFRDDLLVEEQRIVWIHKNGPWSHNVISIMATDIACVNAASGPFFGQVHVKSLTGGPEIFLDKLLRRDVFKFRNLVEGLALATREGLVTKDRNLEDVRESLLRAGHIANLV